MFRSSSRGTCTVLAAIVGLTLTAPAATAIDIAVAGNGRCTVVVSAVATAAEKHAADELAAFLKQVTGASFEIADTSSPAESRLLVGPGAARLADRKLSTDGLGEEGFVIRTVGRDLILAGGRPRGTLYAVYTFLEDHVGCRWWSPTASTIPHRPDLRFGQLDVRHVPTMEYREPFWFSAFDADWAARNRCNGASERLDEPRGGKHVVQGFVHTFYPLIPPATYFKDHPEWFSLINGKRVSENAQLCLTNDEVRAELIKNLRAQLVANPAATMASVSQNDCAGNCQCPKCAAIDAEEGSPAGSMLRFVNAVAAEIDKDHPRVAISTLAYQYTRKPPVQVKPRKNVVVWLCSIECSFAKPLTDPVNEAFRHDIENWSKICERLYVWDYVTNFNHYILPHPNMDVLGPNLQFFAAHHVKGVFEEGAYQTWGAEMMELRAWVLAKLLWNPSLDGRKLIDEFIEGYYGPAAPHIRDYLKLTHDAVIASGDKLGCFSDVNAKFLSIEMLAKGIAILRQAEDRAGNDDALRQRVQVAQMPLLYAFILQWDRLRNEAKAANMVWPVAATQQEVHDQFMKTATAIQTTHVSEGRGLDWLKTQLKSPTPK